MLTHRKKLSLFLFFTITSFVSMFGLIKESVSAEVYAQNVVVTAPPVPVQYLQLEFTSSCTERGAVFRIVNRGKKWPRTAYLRLYIADTKSVISERRIRLAALQKVSFVVEDSVSNGHPVAVWVEPEWYKRDFQFDARVNCN